MVLSTLLDNKFFLKESKCLFGRITIEYLGHVVSFSEVHPTLAKI